jgi:hypothetical protein
MFGNGAAIGIALMTIERWPKKAESRATLLALQAALTQASRASPNECSAAVHSFAPNSIALATWSAHVAKAKSLRQQSSRLPLREGCAEASVAQRLTWSAPKNK